MIIFHLFALLIDAVLAAEAYHFLKKRNALRIIQEEADREGNKKYVLLCFVIAMMSVLAYVYGVTHAEKTFLQAVTDSAVMAWVLLIGYIDWKEHVIPNDLILIAMVFWMIVTVLEIVVGQGNIRNVLLYSLVGFFVVGFVLLAVALIAKSALGMGDVKMFAVLGLFFGLFGAYSILLVTVVTMALVSLMLLAFKKVTTKTALPMAPFTFLGLLIYLLSGV